MIKLENLESRHRSSFCQNNDSFCFFLDDQSKKYSLSELGTLCIHPLENMKKCEGAAPQYNAIYGELKGSRNHLPFGCVLDKVTTNLRFIYWNQNGVVSGSLDPNIRQVCHNK